MILDSNETYEENEEGSLVRERPGWGKWFSWDH